MCPVMVMLLLSARRLTILTHATRPIIPIEVLRRIVPSEPEAPTLAELPC